MGRAVWVCPDCGYRPEEGYCQECPHCASVLVRVDEDTLEELEADW